MLNTKQWTMLLLASFVALAGCKKEDDDPVIDPGKGGKGGAVEKGGKGGAGGAGGAAAAADMAQQDKDRMMWAKLNGLIRDCINRFGSRVLDSRNYYLRRLDPKVGPSGKYCSSRYLYTPYTISDPSSCANAVRKAIASPPKIASLEKAAAGYIAALQILHPILKKASRYYGQGDYKDDKCAQGMDMHTKLLAGWSQFAEHNAKLRAEISRITDELSKRDLQRIVRRFGKGLRYYKKKVMIEAKSTLQIIRLDAKKEMDGQKPNVDLVTAQVKRFQQIAEAMEQTSERMADAARRAFWWSSFKRETFTFLKSCKEYMRRIRSGKGFRRWDRRRLGTSSGWMVSGSFDAALRNYNSLVRASNNVKFRFGR
ncbi:MAG: YiiG family protein [Myxococcales bacterium]|nr:YiiG family protein [Myxococcales bacterium]